MKIKSTNIPTVFVIFGATGDLMEKKISPSLFHLYGKNKLPNYFKIIGFSKQELSNELFNDHIFNALNKHKNINIKTCGLFCDIFSYHKGFFENKRDYLSLAEKIKEIDDKWGICSNKLFYLAVPPQFYKVIFKNLAESGLTKPCSPKEGWSRVLVEKPFGKDLKTAEALDKLLGKLFKEVQIYRIDHYLAKEMLQNILSFRFSNNLFSQSWDNDSIDKIEIRLLETVGVEKRGSFYDSVGALQDVGQNHMLQILALITMDHPLSFEADAIRKQRANILNTLIPLSKEEIQHFTFRSQYDGYRAIEGVDKKSNTETYFKIRAFLDSPRFRGVPIILDSGKRLKEQVKEIEITFKHQTPCLCPPDAKEHYVNKIIISLEPKEAITIQFWSKKPGLEFLMEKRTFDFLLRDQKQGSQYIEEYEKLLLDAIAGDQTLFVSTDEMAAMWRFIDPVIKVWQKNSVPLNYYNPDTDKPISDSYFINDSGLSLKKQIKKEIGIIGLGKMGGNLAKRLSEKGWQFIGYDNSQEMVKKLKKELGNSAQNLKELADKISQPRIIWLMLPAGKIIDEVLFSKNGLIRYLKKDDVIIDGGNSFYKDSVGRHKKLKLREINFLDVGVSGGPVGVLEGSALMIGGDKKVFEEMEPLFYDLSQKQGCQFFGSPGAGHFVKMVHNGIEYGMMQAIAEGFTILKKSNFKLDLKKVVDVYNHGSVIESRLLNWLENALEIHGDDFKNVSDQVGHTGEGEWTVKIAKTLGLRARVIEEALKFRIKSKNNPSYEGKILSALREQFGGHSVK